MSQLNLNITLIIHKIIWFILFNVFHDWWMWFKLILDVLSDWVSNIKICVYIIHDKRFYFKNFRMWILSFRFDSIRFHSLWFDLKSLVHHRNFEFPDLAQCIKYYYLTIFEPSIQSKNKKILLISYPIAHGKLKAIAMKMGNKSLIDKWVIEWEQGCGSLG